MHAQNTAPKAISVPDYWTGSRRGGVLAAAEQIVPTTSVPEGPGEIRLHLGRDSEVIF